MIFLASRGYRCIAFDRRGHGRSSQVWTGHEMDSYADDLAELTMALDLGPAAHVGHAVGGGEIARYVGRHGAHRVSKAVLIGAVTPLMVESEANPDGLPICAFDTIRNRLITDRAQYFKDMAVSFFGADPPGTPISQGLRDGFWMQAMLGGLNAQWACIEAFSQTDFTEDLLRFDMPTLILHGDDDQIVPIDISARRAAKLVSHVQLKIYPGAGHGLCSTHQDRVNADLLDFLERDDPTQKHPYASV